MRICLVYDCLYPYTIGGAERWYDNLSRRLSADGHTVTYLTLKQWEGDSPPRIPGVEVIAVGPRMLLYAGGRRRIVPPLIFGAGVFLHLLRAGRRYDVVHTASFPYFSVLAAAAARLVHRYRLIVDWHEVWTDSYWREYLGPVGGRLGSAVQRLCLRVPQQAFCFSRLHESRLRELRLNGIVTRLEGEYAGSLEAPDAVPADPVVVFAGRHIPEKRVTALIPAFMRARAQIPALRLEVYGDGPDRAELIRLVARHGLGEVVEVPGFVPEERISAALRRGLCLVLPSKREGYGLIVVEAAARGTPSVVVRDPDNAAAELIVEGVNGVVAPSASADDLAAAIVRIHLKGHALRESTVDWFRRNAERISLGHSLDVVTETYST